ncbi:MAG: hypothetical protein VX589_01825 [Myxococcota bacterium]|nr:hypothetical protein [Myxococcota bacterium]
MLGLTKKTWVVLGSLVIFYLGVAALVAYRARPLSPQGSASLIYADDFDRDAPGADYRTATPDLGYETEGWKIQDGRLVGENIHNAALWLQQPLPERVRIEFDARAETDNGDVKCEVFGDGRNHQSGYILIFGGWKNRVTCIARLDEHAEERKTDNRCPVRNGRARCVEPGVDYRWTIERRDGTVLWYLDGRLHLTYADTEPLMGRFFGFNNWASKTSFDNLRIYRLDTD